MARSGPWRSNSRIATDNRTVVVSPSHWATLEVAQGNRKDEDDKGKSKDQDDEDEDDGKS